MRAVWLVRAAAYGFLLAGVAALAYCALVWIGAERFQARQARAFERVVNARKTPPPPFHPTVLPDGSLLGRLEIPSVGISVMVVEGDGDGDLRRAVGHIPGTALPGGNGNVGIAGHRDTFFRPLRFIRPNDSITLDTLAGTYRYRVVSAKVVPPQDVKVLFPTGRATLTLVTCFPFYYIGAAPKRFIVRADLEPRRAMAAAPRARSRNLNPPAAP